MSKSNNSISTSAIRPEYPTAIIGDSIYQKQFGTTLYRLTNSQRIFKQGVWTPGAILGGYMSNSEPHWSNCDDGLLLASYTALDAGRSHNVVGLWSNTMNLITTLPVHIGQYYIRWSALSNHYFYHFTGSGVDRYIIPTMRKHRWLFGFNAGMAGGEGDVSDTNEILLDKNGERLFIYDLTRMRIVPGSYSPYDLELGSLGAKGTAQGVDYATLSQCGKYILVSWSGRIKEHYGIEVYDREWKYLRRIYPDVIHWITAVDADGRPVIYTTLPFGAAYFIDPYKDAGYKPGDLVKIYVDTGEIVKLLDMPKWSHFMLAKRRNHPEHIYVTFEERTLPANAGTLWLKPAWSFGFGELLQVNTNGTGFKRLCHTWCRPSDTTKKLAKWWQPDNFVFGNKVGFRSCVVNDEVPEMSTGIGDLFYVNV